MTRKVPKLSGLLSMGHIPQASKEALDRMPTFATPGSEQASPSEVDEGSPAKGKPTWAFQPDDTELEVTERGTVLIPLGRLRPSPFNARKVRTSGRIQDIANSMLADQQREPITVYPGVGEDQGHYMIASGATRHLAAISLGWNAIEAWIDSRINSSDPLAIVRISHLHNDSAPETDLDHAAVARDLLDAGYTQIQVATALGYKNHRQITRLKAYYELPESVLEYGKAYPEKFSANLAELFKVAVSDIGEDATLSIQKTAFTDNLSIRNIEMLIDAEKRRHTRGTNTRTRSTRISTFDIKAAGSKVGTMTVLQMSPDKKRVQLDATVDPATADILSERLEKLLKDFAAGYSNA